MDEDANHKLLKKHSLIHRITCSLYNKNRNSHKAFLNPTNLILISFLILLFIIELIIDILLFKLHFFSLLTIALIHFTLLIVLLVPLIYLLNKSIATDLTKNRKDEAVLKEAEATKYGLSETDFDAVLIFENDICISQNKTAETIFGYSDTEAIGKSIAQWIAPEDMARINEDLFADKPIQYEITTTRKNGSQFQALVQSRLINYDNHQLK